MDSDLHRIHRQAADWLIMLREDPHNPTTEERFEAWLDEDPAHARAWASVSDIFDTIGETDPAFEGAWPDAPAPSLRAQQGMRARLARRLPARPRRSYIGGAIAAALAVAWLMPSAMLRLQADHITGAGQMETVTLADGSTVRLGPESAVAVEYDSGTRMVRLLAGQAWFDVRHDPHAPFRVSAGEVRTTVLGTSFDVRRNGQSTSVSVARGRVRVVDHGTTPAPARELTAGDWANVDGEHRMTNGTANPELLGVWREGKLIARNRRIADVIEELRPWHQGKIVVLSPALTDKRIDGVFDARNPAGALSAIAEQAGGTVRHITPWVLIVS